MVAVVRHRRVSAFALPPFLCVVAFALPVVVLQRVVPFERVWLFLLPAYLTTAAAGVLYLLRPLARGRTTPRAVAVAAVALCAALAGLGAANRAVAHSEDTSTFRDAGAVVEFLAARLGPHDRVLANPPADLVLEYYLDARGLDGGRILYTDADARRTFAVVKEGSRDYPLATVLAWHLPPQEARRLRPVVLRRFPHAVVYRLLDRGG